MQLATKIDDGVQSQSVYESDFNRIHAKVMVWDLSILKRYIQEKGIYKTHKIDGAEREYKRYMSLIMSYPGKHFAISREIDDFWHTHIIFTKDYHAMCESICGRLIHHRPSILDVHNDIILSRKKTDDLYVKHFGLQPKAYWGPVVCKECCNDD